MPAMENDPRRPMEAAGMMYTNPAVGVGPAVPVIQPGEMLVTFI